MARLQWNQVDAPNFAGSIIGLNNAGKSFDEGMKGIASTIAANKERQGQQISNDILLDMANIYREDQIPDFINNIRTKYGDNLENLTPEVRKYLADPREIIIQNEQRRANVQGTKLNNVNKANDINFDQKQKLQNILANEYAEKYRIAKENGNMEEAQQFKDLYNQSLIPVVNATNNNIFDSNTINSNSSEGSNPNNANIAIKTDFNGNTYSVPFTRQTSKELDALFKDNRINKSIQNMAENYHPDNDAAAAEQIATSFGYKSEQSINAIKQMIAKNRQNVIERSGNANRYGNELDDLLKKNDSNTVNPSTITDNSTQINTNNQSNSNLNNAAQINAILGQYSPNTNNISNQDNIPQTDNSSNQNISNNLLNSIYSAAGVNPNQQIIDVSNPNINLNNNTNNQTEETPKPTEVGIRDTNNIINLAKKDPLNLIQQVEEQNNEVNGLVNTNGQSNTYRAYLDNKEGKNKYNANIQSVATMLKDQADSDGKKLSQESAMSHVEGMVDAYANEIQKNLESDENFKGIVDKSFIKNYLLQTITPENWFRANTFFPNGRFSQLKGSSEIENDLKSFFQSGGVKSVARLETLENNKKIAQEQYFPKIQEIKNNLIALSQSNPLNESGNIAKQKEIAFLQSDLYKYSKLYTDTMNEYVDGITKHSGINNNNNITNNEVFNKSTNDSNYKNNYQNDQKIISDEINAGNIHAQDIRKTVNAESRDLSDIAKKLDNLLAGRKASVKESLDQDVLNKLPKDESEKLINENVYNNDDIKDKGWLFSNSRETTGNIVKHNILSSLSQFDPNSGMEIQSIALNNPEVKQFYDNIIKMSGKDIMSNYPNIRNRLDDILNDVKGRTQNVISRYNNK